MASLAEEALEAYVARDFARAAALFQAILRRRSEDQPAAILLERCREFLDVPPPGDWNGVYVAGRK